MVHVYTIIDTLENVILAPIPSTSFDAYIVGPLFVFFQSGVFTPFPELESMIEYDNAFFDIYAEEEVVKTVFNSSNFVVSSIILVSFDSSPFQMSCLTKLLYFITEDSSSPSGEISPTNSISFFFR